MSSEIYYIVFVVLSVVALFSISREGRKYSNILLIFVSVFMILLAGLRDDSPDQQAYRNIFNKVVPIDEVLIGNHNYHDVYGDWGYLFLNSLIKYFSDRDIVLFLVLASLIVGMVVYTCRRISPYPLVSLLCYYSWFYYSNLGALRHALATSLILMMVLMLAQNRKILAMPLYSAAVFTHKASIAAVMLWMSHFVTKWRQLLILTILVAVVISINGGIGTKVLEAIIPFVSDGMKDKFSFYAQSETWGANAGILRGVVVKQLLIILMCFIYINPLKDKFPAFPVLFGSYVISILIVLLLQDLKIFADRFSNVFAISEIILIPMLLSLFSGKEKIIAFCFLSIMLLYQVYLLMGNEFYPYKFVFT